eukprot:TRINITY_DN500_c0_g1_i3.p1 TRINITY_DN500_c0_g1~~TRINITY_DN500_c0_g1_i3.p1  ORF type:complete len:321 (-),score=44.32 TRINITY_DN500_c0_g1_i3:195-1157(-)
MSLKDLIPDGLYSPIGTKLATVSGASESEPLMACSALEKPKIKMHSGEFYQACTIGGILSCGLTHTMVTPLDVVKCNIQTNPAKYPGIAAGFGVVLKESGMAGLFKGWVPTLIGYSFQGACKFGFYEFFKKYYSDLAGPDAAVKYQTLIYLAGSASAELIADVALCPFEAVKVKVQTDPSFGCYGLFDGGPKFVAQNGYAALYKGLTPLWARQVPYTMMKFASFENVVAYLYKYVVPKPKAQCNKVEQLGVSFLAGYIAGVFLCNCFPPCRQLSFKIEQEQGRDDRWRYQRDGMVQIIYTRYRFTYYYDWYVDRLVMGYL